MDEQPLQLLIAFFQDEQGYQEAIDVLKSASKEKQRGIHGAVAITKDQNSAIHYKDVGLTPAKGALSGVILGTALGILSGGIGIALGTIGALVGSLFGAKKRSGQFSDVRMHELVASLAPGTSAILAIVEPEQLAELEKEIEIFEVEIFITEVSADLGEELDSHRQAAYAEWVEKLEN
jgi:uncharacterized membrane protein